jgi:hypothetical protein
MIGEDKAARMGSLPDYSTTPVEYNDRARKARLKYGICPLCGLVRDLVLDHCHDHWLARGSVCYSCNMRMSYLDHGYWTSRGYAAKFHEWRYRCPTCKERESVA